LCAGWQLSPDRTTNFNETGERGARRVSNHLSQETLTTMLRALCRGRPSANVQQVGVLWIINIAGEQTVNFQFASEAAFLTPIDGYTKLRSIDQDVDALAVRKLVLVTF